jgi:plasmid segregation protein ParM
MREIREYNMNGTIILGVDNGYGNVKTAHRVFPTGIMKCDSEPVLSKEYIEYDGTYYIIGEGHKGFVADKQKDDDTYILTLAAIAKELEARGLTEARIHLAVGLPLKWVQAQRESFKKYLIRERYVSLKYRKKRYVIEIVDCTVMPQGYAAVAEKLRDFKGMNLLVDIGNGTMNIMYLNNGRPIESKSWTEKLGVHQCFIRIQNEIMNRTGVKIQEEIINQFLIQGEIDASDIIQNLVKEVAEQYVKELFDKLYDYEYNEDLMRLYVMGGGAKMVEMFGKYNPDRTTFNHDICANAKGYEYFCYMMLRQKLRK